jgi:hypothetical protein
MGSVRRNSLCPTSLTFRSVSHFPADIADRWLPDTLSLPPHTALPIALLLHVLHFLARAPLFLEPKRRRGRGELDDLFKTPEEISRGNLERFERAEAGARRGVVGNSGVSKREVLQLTMLTKRRAGFSSSLRWELRE